MQAWNAQPAGTDGIIAILDSRTYTENLSGTNQIVLPEGSRLLLLAADWALTHESEASQFSMLLYLAFVLPLFGPLSRWTHIQLSVIVFVALLWTLYRHCISGSAQFENHG